MLVIIQVLFSFFSLFGNQYIAGILAIPQICWHPVVLSADTLFLIYTMPGVICPIFPF